MPKNNISQQLSSSLHSSSVSASQNEGNACQPDSLSIPTEMETDNESTSSKVTELELHMGCCCVI